MLKILAAILILFTPQYAFSQSQTDFNKDGISDITFVRIRADGGLTWRYRNSKTKKKKSFSTIGRNGDHIALAKWKRTLPSIPGIVALTAANEIQWTVESKGITESILLGKKGDLIVSGADLNANGAADAIVVSISNKTLIWEVRLDPFDGGTSPARQISFGLDGDIPFFASLTGTGDQLGLLRQLPNGSQEFIFKDITTGVESAFTISDPVKDPMRPVPVKQSTGANIIAIPSQTESRTIFTLFHVNGKKIRKVSIAAKGDIIVGNYFSKDRGEELAVKSKSDFKIINPYTKTSGSILVTADIPVDEININSFGFWGSTSVGCVASNPRDGWKRGFIWKPNSDTQFYGVAILPNRFTNTTQSVTATKIDGTTINAFFSKGCANPDDEGPRCSWMATPFTGSKYRSDFGSIRLKVVQDNGNCETFALDDPSKRID